MYSYATFGIAIDSEFPLPGLTARIGAGSGGGTPVVVRTVTGPSSAEASGETFYWASLNRTEAVFAPRGVGVFRASSGRSITVSPAPGADPDLLRLYLVGQVLPALLYQRGKLVLHASVVSFGGAVAAFVGQSGSGKSSIAAALYAAGHNLIADDTGVVELTDADCMILPGSPELKLDPDIASWVALDQGSSHELHAAVSKRVFPMSRRLGSTPLPLRAIYVLDSGSRVRIDALAPHAALVEILRYSLPTRLGLVGDALHLTQCAQLAETVSICRLSYIRDRSLLPGLAQLIERDFEVYGEHTGLSESTARSRKS